MAWHTRHVAPVNTSESPRVTVLFEREDLLWTSPGGEPVQNPYTKTETDIPLRNEHGALIGPNIFDVIDKVERDKKDLVELGIPPVTDNEGHYFVLRPASEFFDKPKKKKKKSSPSNNKDYLLYPFKKSLSTAGAPVTGALEGDFIRIRKKSTVSISRLSFLLASGMYGSSLKASAMIGQIASDAWSKDLIRAKHFYDLVVSSSHGIQARNVPASTMAASTISQHVETLILREACTWMGIDPDTKIQRKRGRPAGEGKADLGDDSHAGNVLVIRLSADGEVTGSFIADFAGYTTGTALETLDLKELANLLVELQDADQVTDVELLEAYLEAADPDWRDKILEDEADDAGSASRYDPYSVLGVDQNASLEEITRAYRKAMQKVHPDRSGLPGFFAQEVVKAYKSLKGKFEHE
ncbi:J domain-containing protein [Kistimonas asteriae]|uniref:J domain-containing protein n=1 Tax=Kistimonas asteriae TaxID=517724 RepID=UPI001FE9FD76|nr:J domain-containing protein [Kistimonas asteriae]